MNKIQKELKLLPGYYKKIGIALFGVVILIIILSIADIIVTADELLKNISGSILLIAFLLIALARDKIEDEFTLVLRLRAFTATFIWGVIMTVTDPFINLLFEGEFITEKGAIGMLNTMFVFYFIMFYILKKSR